MLHAHLSVCPSANLFESFVGCTFQLGAFLSFVMQERGFSELGSLFDCNVPYRLQKAGVDLSRHMEWANVLLIASGEASKAANRLQPILNERCKEVLSARLDMVGSQNAPRLIRKVSSPTITPVVVLRLSFVRVGIRTRLRSQVLPSFGCEIPLLSRIQHPHVYLRGGLGGAGTLPTPHLPVFSVFAHVTDWYSDGTELVS